MRNSSNQNKKENKAAVLVLLLLPYVIYIAALVLLCVSLWSFARSSLPLIDVVITAPDVEKPVRDYTPVVIAPPEAVTPETEAPVETEAETAPAASEAIAEAVETAPAAPEAIAETEAETEPPIKANIPALPKAERSPTTGIITERDMSDFPKIKFGQQWATMNIDGWKKRDIPVYCGDTDEILSYGAGMSYYSRFCGQNGKTVISGHVMTDFYEIEDTEIGDYIVIDTVYAHFVYEVTEITVFGYKDATLLMPDDGNATLVMYTCYPRVDGLAFKEERIALVATMIEGVRYAW